MSNGLLLTLSLFTLFLVHLHHNATHLFHLPTPLLLFSKLLFLPPAFVRTAFLLTPLFLGLKLRRMSMSKVSRRFSRSKLRLRLQLCSSTVRSRYVFAHPVLHLDFKFTRIPYKLNLTVQFSLSDESSCCSSYCSYYFYLEIAKMFEQTLTRTALHQENIREYEMKKN